MLGKTKRLAFWRILLVAGAMIVGDSALVEADPPTFPAIPFLSGLWHADDGGLYYIRQLGSEIWWGGMSTASTAGYLDFFKGLQFTNVFHGTISGTRITGTWVDVPRGTALGNGTLVLDVLADSPSGWTLHKVSASGDFRGSVWHNSIIATPVIQCSATPGIRCDYDTVRKNSGRTLYEELKPEKNFAVIFGWVSEGLSLNYPADFGHTYGDFIRAAGSFFLANPDLGDGDLNFNVRLDYQRLSPDFWTTDWEYPDGPSIVRSKLRVNGDQLHGEIIMFGRSDANHPPLLPGWAESNPNSVLWNGSPLNGGVSAGPPASINGYILPVGTLVRVTGVLNLDCGHFPGNCEDDELAEIHPVYSVDVIQAWTHRLPNADLTGVWAGSTQPGVASVGDEGTYYVRQLGDTVWWLGLSRDQGRMFANVFQGTISRENIQGAPRQVINGNWADIPLGAASSSGTMKLWGTLCVSGSCDVRQPIALYNSLGVVEVSGGFGGRAWEKLYDRGRPLGPPVP